MTTTFNDKPFVVQSPDVTYTEDEMVSKYTYQVLPHTRSSGEVYSESVVTWVVLSRKTAAGRNLFFMNQTAEFRPSPTNHLECFAPRFFWIVLLCCH